jgi:uridine kinase
LIVAVDGFGASGKSVFAARLASRFGGNVVGLDDFTRPGTPTWEHERFVDEILTPLRDGHDAVYRPWRYDQVSPGQLVTIPCGLVVVEGVSALTLQVVERVGIWWDLSVWVEAGEDLRRARIAARDGAPLLPLWEERWWPSEQRYFADEDPLSRADFVLRATDGGVGGGR